MRWYGPVWSKLPLPFVAFCSILFEDLQLTAPNVISTKPALHLFIFLYILSLFFKTNIKTYLIMPKFSDDILQNLAKVSHAPVDW